MSLASMTGFARAEGAHMGASWFWEVRSVNHRGLDLRMRLAPGLETLEAPIRVMAAERFKRGALNLSVSYSNKPVSSRIKVNADALAQAIAAIQLVQRHLDVSPPAAEGILAIRGVLEPDDSQPDEAGQSGRDAAILTSLATALDALQQARRGEGRRLAQVLRAQIDDMESLVATAARSAATQPDTMRAKLEEQIKMLLGAGASVSPDRLAQELALLAVKADVREELDRLTAHIAQARELLEQGEAVGRRLDFLAQELNREANTLCAKSADLDLTRAGLALKACVDQFKEQVQNVE
ncbi:MAG TPA: YicC family protein [Alphaproteobacteria bacterium]|nr:YicC family protein [Alphaproteobacteria bacterium]